MRKMKRTSEAISDLQTLRAGATGRIFFTLAECVKFKAKMCL